MESVDAIVVGAGVVGLSIGRALAMAGYATLILDGESRFGSWTSARNSEVLHAGIYYPADSLKAKLCVEGRSLAYEFCAARGVPHQKTGKLIFAHSHDQLSALDSIEHAAMRAGVQDLQRLSAGQAARLEPALRCAEALLSPSSGVVDSHAFMLALLADAEAHGAVLVCNSLVDHVSRKNGQWFLTMAGESAPSVATGILVNACGLGAQRLARATEGLALARIPALYLARGVYFTYSGRVPFCRLIYPIPEHGGLGIHLTLDLAGRAKFGPDVEWIDTVDYSVNPRLHEQFAEAARRIWPQIDPARLEPGYAGIRPKLSGPGEPAADFSISGPKDHGLEGLVNLFGIESPGLTASLAIGPHVLRLLQLPVV